MPCGNGNSLKATPALEKTSALSSILIQTLPQLNLIGTSLHSNDEPGWRRILIRRTHTTATMGSSISPSSSSLSLTILLPFFISVPTPRRPPPLFPSGTKNSKTRTTDEIKTPINLLRRRLTLDEVYPENEELSREAQGDAEGAIRSGAIVTETETPRKRFTGTPLSPAGTTGTTGTTATPSKKGKLPVEVARLHRVGLVFLKELDKKVFGGALGSRYLPDLPIDPLPAPDTLKRKGKGRKPADPNPIYNMGSIGYFDDDQSTISVIWSNRMQTTAGRTEYHKYGAIM